MIALLSTRSFVSCEHNLMRARCESRRVVLMVLYSSIQRMQRIKKNSVLHDDSNVSVELSDVVAQDQIGDEVGDVGPAVRIVLGERGRRGQNEDEINNLPLTVGVGKLTDLSVAKSRTQTRYFFLIQHQIRPLI